MKKLMAVLLTVSVGTALCSCGQSSNNDVSDEASEAKKTYTGSLPAIETSTWNYNKEDDVYWQAGISYCESPADLNYETLAVFVPGAYMHSTDNGDGTYTCEVDEDGAAGNYTAETAPIVIPVNTPGYSAMSPLSDYSNGAVPYTSEGFIYVHAGCRGREEGAPSGVTDLKAAIRYIRYSADSIPGDMERIFSFGMSGGGAQSALLGSTGDSELYSPYLEAVGAAMTESDAIMGSMCWCPITNLDMANEAYEWNMGMSREGLDDEAQALSDDMAEAFAEYMNKLGLRDEGGTSLVLAESAEGIYQSGSYYDYVKSAIETSLSNFLSDTEFPYSPSSGGMDRGMGGGIEGGRAGMMDGNFPDDIDKDSLSDGTMPEGKRDKKMDGNLPDGMDAGNLPDGESPSDSDVDVTGGYTDENGHFQNDGVGRTGNASLGGLELSGTYETPQDYIDALNAEGEWVDYDASTGEVSITSIADFVTRLKIASKNVGAFDDLDATQAENTLFGYGDGSGAHFDPVMADLLSELNSSYADSYASDLEKTDSLGMTVGTRVNMYNPLYFLCDYYDGMGSSNVAKYWRIRTGIEQGDTALTTEINLMLALSNYGSEVDFETVWGQGHTQAERTGTSTENFIRWVNECLNF